MPEPSQPRTEVVRARNGTYALALSIAQRINRLAREGWRFKSFTGERTARKAVLLFVRGTQRHVRRRYVTAKTARGLNGKIAKCERTNGVVRVLGRWEHTAVLLVYG